MIPFGYPPALPQGAPTPPGLSAGEIVLLCLMAALSLVLVILVLNQGTMHRSGLGTIKADESPAQPAR